MGRRFRIKPERLRSAAGEIHEQSVLAVKVSEEILDVTQGFKGMPQMQEVCQALRKISEETRYESALLQGVSNSASRIGMAYDKTESDIYSYAEKSRRLFSRHKVSGWRYAKPQINQYWFRLLQQNGNGEV